MSSPWTSALVTGASSGIGAAMVEHLARDGVATVAVARRIDRLEALANRWGNIDILVADLERAPDRQRVAARVAETARPVELLVNNAGFGASGPLASLAVEPQLGQINLNVAALVALSHAATGAMVARRRGWILNVSSVAGFMPAPGAATYAATKAFVTSFSESLAEEVRGQGVVVTALCPGLTRSEFHERSTSFGDKAGLGARAPSLAWMSAPQVARIGLEGCASGKVIVVPGAINRAMIGLSELAPRVVRRRVSGLLRRSR